VGMWDKLTLNIISIPVMGQLESKKNVHDGKQLGNFLLFMGVSHWAGDGGYGGHGGKFHQEKKLGRGRWWPQRVKLSRREFRKPNLKGGTSIKRKKKTILTYISRARRTSASVCN